MTAKDAYEQGRYDYDHGARGTPAAPLQMGDTLEEYQALLPHWRRGYDAALRRSQVELPAFWRANWGRVLP